jgi:hypothetical protein
MVQTAVERNIQAVVEGVSCAHDFGDEGLPWTLSHLNASTDCTSTLVKKGGKNCLTLSSCTETPELTPAYHHEERTDPLLTNGIYAAIWRSTTAWGDAAVTAVLGGELFVWEAGDTVMLLDSDQQAGVPAPERMAGASGACGAGFAAGGRAEFGRKFRFDLADVTAPLLRIGK